MASDPTPVPTSVQVSAEVTSLLDRVKSAVADVTAAVRSLQPKVQEYFTEQLERSRVVVDDLTKASLNVRDTLKDIPVSELPVVLALEATSRGRAVVAELSARATRYDEENNVSATVSAVVEGARSRTIAVFADASVRLHSLKDTLQSTAADLAARVSPTAGGPDGATPAGDVPLPASPRDVRTTVTDLLAALEDIVHHAAEHERIVQARAAAASVSARAVESASTARSHASKLLTAASERASGVAGELRVTLGRISALPPLTLKELRALASDAHTVAGSVVATATTAATAAAAAASASVSVSSGESSTTPTESTPAAAAAATTTTTEEREWASSVTRSLVDVLGRANDSLQQVKEAVLAAAEEDSEDSAATSDDKATASAAGSGSSDTVECDASAPPPLPPSQARRLVLGSIRLARRHASDVVERTQKALSSRQERLVGAAKDAGIKSYETVGQLATSVDERLGVVDRVAGLVVSVDRKFGVSESASSVAAKLETRFSLTERYAHALATLQGVDQRLTGGRGATVVATGRDLAAPTVSYVKGKYDAAVAPPPAGDAPTEVEAEAEAEAEDVAAAAKEVEA